VKITGITPRLKVANCHSDNMTQAYPLEAKYYGVPKQLVQLIQAMPKKNDRTGAYWRSFAQLDLARKIFVATLVAGAVLAGAVAGASGTHAQEATRTADQLGLSCNQESSLPSPDCGTTPTPTFDKLGRLWVAFSSHGHVYVAYADGVGQGFHPPVAVNRTPESIYADGENRPKLIIGPEGRIYVSWTRKTPGRFTGDVRFARSMDNTERFSDPVTVNQDHTLISHRFDGMAIDSKGNIYLAWLDKRDQAAAKTAGKDYAGAALYYAVSTDGGNHFGSEQKVADNSCECCRIALATDQDDHVKVLWRQIFGGNIRDHALATLGLESPVTPVRRVTYDDWKADVCPHHGPDLAVDSRGRVHMTWFTQGPTHQGLMYGRFDPERDRLEFTQLLDGAAGASHPQVLAVRDTLYTAWKTFDGTKTDLRVRRSDDHGKTWTRPQVVATTTGKSDHPILLQTGDKVFASWHTQTEGFRLLSVQPSQQEASGHARQ
jgi:hypothetical protein